MVLSPPESDMALPAKLQVVRRSEIEADTAR
jgi:hypothetical protein